MLFNTWEFCIFFILVLAGYACLSHRRQNILLLAASVGFYAWWDWRFTGLLIASILINYVGALQIYKAADSKSKFRRLWIVLGLNLGILAFFKYFNFFTRSLTGLLSAIGMSTQPWVLDVILPIGISFYTFQGISYAVDVYKGNLEPEQDPLVLGLFISFFPQLIAGPIERATHLLPQFKKPRVLSLDNFSAGSVLILLGLVRKVAIGDVAAARVDAIFSNPESATSLGLLVGVCLFAIQIYCDFAGYSSMARGLARILGFDLMENFQQPYFATNITEFWRRWHISLSTWLRDYLYIPLGGNRGTQWMAYRNLMLTMLLGGLWHGASWNFVIWGALHGVALSVHKLWTGRRKVPERAAITGVGSLPRILASWVLTLTVVLLSWVFFRASGFSTAVDYLQGIAQLEGGIRGASLMLLVQLAGTLFIIDLGQYLSRNQVFVLNWHWLPRGFAYAAAVIFLLCSKPTADVPFIYFQF